MTARTSLITLCCALALAATAARAADFTVAVDAREAARRILHVKQTFVAKPGAMALSYPKWIPGEHGPTGPNTDVAGLVVTAAGRTLTWRRDAVDMNTVRFDAPAGAAAVEVSFDFLLDGAPNGFSSAASATENLLLLSWNEVSMCPAGRSSDSLTCDASVQLPAGWKYGTPLETRAGSGGVLRFATCTYTTLVDSPVLAGRHFRVVDLAPGDAIPQRLDMACDSEEGLAIPESQITTLRRLMKEADALFGTRHFRHYDFLLTLSDHTAHFGLEHHESSDDRARERMWLDDDLRRHHSGLLSHELVHSWNGKFRRPAGLATGDFATPMQDELLWVYEGLTQYLGYVLAARAGIRTPDEAREDLATTAALMEANRGRTWRPLVDTAVEAQLLYEARDAWTHWRRSTDFYEEGLLMWLEADVTIRRLSNGQRSLDDFCRRFHGGPNHGPEVKTYTLADVIATLNAVEPYDWAKFLSDRVDSVRAHAPLGGITGGGWSLAWADTLGPMQQSDETARKNVDETYSIGLTIDTETSNVTDVVPGSAADRAGVAPEMKLLGVNGRRWNDDVLRDAIAAAKKSGSVELLLENKEFYRDAKLTYRDGRRYPALRRAGGGRDWLSEILAPRAR
jgi:predicted metalloprotease with PDZ domain